MLKRYKEYKIDGFTMILNKKHGLPSYQKHFKMYDRFLPVLATKLGG